MKIIGDRYDRRGLDEVILEAARRTVSDNGQDFVENAIDVAFEPIERVAGALDRLFNW